MKTLLFVILFATHVVSSSTGGVEIDFSVGGPYEDFNVIGHRGCGMNGVSTSEVFENTVNSFLRANKLGAQWIELDVHLTKDRVPIVFHDFVIKVGGTDNVLFQMKLQEFLHAVGNVDEGNNDLPCTLERVLHCIGDIGVNIELKYPPRLEIERYNFKDVPSVEEFVSKVVEVVRKCGKRKIVFSSFDPFVAEQCKISRPNFLVYLLVNFDDNGYDEQPKTIDKVIDVCRKFLLDGVCIDWMYVSSCLKSFVVRINSEGLRVVIHGCDEYENEEVVQMQKKKALSMIVDDIPRTLRSIN